jgi:hypothetical protein
MKQGEEFIIQPKDSHLKKDVCKIKVLENTRTTIFFQVEEGHEKVRLLHSDFEKEYRIIEQIEKEEKIKLFNKSEIEHLEWVYYRFPNHFSVSENTDYLIKFKSIIEKLKTQL